MLDRYHTRFVRAGAAARSAGAGPAGRHQRAAGHARHPVRAERARRREVLFAGAGGGRPCRPARICPRQCPRRGRGARPSGQIRHHARPLLGRDLPAIFRPPRPARETVPGLDQARRERRRIRQPRHHRRDGGACAPSGQSSWALLPSPPTGSTTRWRRPRPMPRHLLEDVWSRARAKAAAERDALQAMVAEEGGNFALAPWDWRYYAEKLRKARYDLDEAEIKPYFQLDKLIEAAFETAHRLFGLTFTPVAVPLYHADARAWEVKDADGRHVGLFIGDYFARASKHSGAWMTSLRDQEKLVRRYPPGHPQRLQFFQAGRRRAGAAVVRGRAHAVPRIRPRAARAACPTSPIRCIAGTAVSSDFVELPSQLYEHWLEVPEILQKYARHAATGEADAQGAARTPARHPHLQPGLRHDRIHRLRAGRSRHPFAGQFERPRRDRLRARGPRAHRHAGGDRHAPPPAALPASVLRRPLRLGLLLIHVVGGARRRRLRGLRGNRRRVRSGDREAPARLHLQRRQPARPGGSLQGLPRPAAERRCAVEEARARRPRSALASAAFRAASRCAHGRARPDATHPTGASSATGGTCAIAPSAARAISAPTRRSAIARACSPG